MATTANQEVYKGEGNNHGYFTLLIVFDDLFLETNIWIFDGLFWFHHFNPFVNFPRYLWTCNVMQRHVMSCNVITTNHIISKSAVSHFNRLLQWTRPIIMIFDCEDFEKRYKIWTKSWKGSNFQSLWVRYIVLACWPLRYFAPQFKSTYNVASSVAHAVVLRMSAAMLVGDNGHNIL